MPSVETSNGIQPVSYNRGEIQYARPSISINPSRKISPLNLQKETKNTQFISNKNCVIQMENTNIERQVKSDYKP